MRPIKIVSTVRTAAFLAVFAGTSFAQIKNVAVIETDIDAQSGANAQITSADARQLTAELRREAVNNLPTDKYNVMTSETVYAQGGAVLESCADENCVITLGSKIGADYIVRGTISKFQTLFTLVVEIYDTEDGNLVASSDPIRSRIVEELLEKTAAACAKMYRTFADAQNRARKPPATYSVTVNVNPAKGGYVYPNVHKTDVKAGDELTLTAMAYQGYTFAGWSGAETAADTTNLLKITVDGDMEIVANFIREAKVKGTARRRAVQMRDAVSINTTVNEGESLAKPAPASKAKGTAKRRAAQVRDAVPFNTTVKEGENWTKPTLVAKTNEKKFDWYFAPRYQIPGSYLTPKNGAANFEFGHVRGKGSFVGFVFDVGNSESAETMIGGGVNFGSVYNLPVDLQLVYGWAFGFWHMEKSYISGQNSISKEETGAGGGPIAGLRWRYLELLYRGQLGGARDVAYHNQLSIGLYLATNSRTKSN